MKNCWLCCLVAVVLLVPTRADADVWDVNTNNDNTPNTTRNQLVHGTRQMHDLGALGPSTADQDWYWVTMPAYSSFEVVVDGTSGDINATISRVASDGVTVLQLAAGIGVGFSQRLAFANATASSVNYLIFVGNAACGGLCGADDTYTISARETTVSLARFNNTGSQITVLLTQNASEVPINGSIFYWSTSGTLLGTTPLVALAVRNLNVLNTSSVTGAVGGHITIVHDGPYGGLNAKSVALEPATGFSFDTAGVYKGF